jgi:hypothetical protein
MRVQYTFSEHVHLVRLIAHMTNSPMRRLEKKHVRNTFFWSVCWNQRYAASAVQCSITSKFTFILGNGYSQKPMLCDNLLKRRILLGAPMYLGLLCQMYICKCFGIIRTVHEHLQLMMKSLTQLLLFLHCY